MYVYGKIQFYVMLVLLNFCKALSIACMNSSALVQFQT